MEAVGKNGSLVTDYAYKQNIYSASQFLNDYLKSRLVYDDDVILVADGAYRVKIMLKLQQVIK